MVALIGVVVALRSLGVLYPTWPGTVVANKPVGACLGGIIGLLRLLTGDTAQLPFVVVASITLAVLLLGWRGLAALIRARGSRRAKSEGQVAPRHDRVRPAP